MYMSVCIFRSNRVTLLKYTNHVHACTCIHVVRTSNKIVQSHAALCNYSTLTMELVALWIINHSFPIDLRWPWNTAMSIIIIVWSSSLFTCIYMFMYSIYLYTIYIYVL